MLGVIGSRQLGSYGGTVGLGRAGTRLTANGNPVRLAGANAYWVGLDDNQGGTPGTFPTQSQLAAAFSGIRDMGANLVRAHTVGMSAGTSMSFETAPGTFVSANLDAADYAVYQAKLNGIYLMVPLTDQWNYYHGGKWNFVHWAYQQNPTGLTDTPGTVKGDSNENQFFGTNTDQLRIRTLFKAYINAWLNHVNPYTGLAYKDDPTIAIVETGNEIYSATAEWTQDIAAYIKSIAPNKLVADGSAATGLAVSSMPGLNASSIDILGSHYYVANADYSQQIGFTTTPSQYGSTTSALNQLSTDVTSAVNAGKAFIVGEFPWTRADVSSWYSAVEGNTNITGDLFWSQIADSFVHGGAFGGDDYPVHRPYNGATEKTYAPQLAKHISTTSGVANRGDATTPYNLIQSTAIQRASDASLFGIGSGTLTTDTTVSQEGGSSIKVTPAAASYPYWYFSTYTNGARVTPGQQYTAFASVRTTTGGTGFGFHTVLIWKDSNGNDLSTSAGAYTAANAGSWVTIPATATAPANAVWATVQVQADNQMAVTDVFNVDEYGVNLGTSTVWTTPSATSYTGDSSTAATPGSSSTGVRTATGAATSTATPGSASIGVRSVVGDSSTTATAGSSAAGQLTLVGTATSTATPASTAAGSITASGNGSSTATPGSSAAGQYTAVGNSTATAVSGSASTGVRSTFGDTSTTAAPGSVSAGTRTATGDSSSTVTPSSAASSTRTVSGDTTTTITPAQSSTGTRTAVADATSTATPGFTASGVRTATGAASSTANPGSVAAGTRSTTGDSSSTASPSSASAGIRGTSGDTTSTVTPSSTAPAGQRSTFGDASSTVTPGSLSSSQKLVTGDTTTTAAPGSTSTGVRSTFADTSSTVTPTSTAAGTRTAVAAATVTATPGSSATGTRTATGTASSTATPGSTAGSTRTVYGDSTSTATTSSAATGTRSTLGDSSTTATAASTSTGTRTVSGDAATTAAPNSSSNGIRGTSGDTTSTVTPGQASTGARTVFGDAISTAILITAALGLRTTIGQAASNTTPGSVADGTATPVTGNADFTITVGIVYGSLLATAGLTGNPLRTTGLTGNPLRTGRITTNATTP